MAEISTAKTCFVIMPFSGTDDPTMGEAEWTEVFTNTFKPAIEATGYLCNRSQIRTGSFVRDILESLWKADLVVADLSGRKPNVSYELGIRHSLKHKTIIVAQAVDYIPSDLRSYWCTAYGWRTEPEREKFKKDIADVIAEVEKEPDRSDSPVYDFLHGTGIPWYEGTGAITIRPGTSSHMGFEPGDPRPRATFAHVQVFNGGVFAPRMRCFVRFLREDGSEIFDREMPGRWSGTPEPYTVVAVPAAEAGMLIQNVFDLSKLPSSYFQDLAMKDTDSVAVAIKFEDGTCWGWTGESYRFGARHPAWPLPIGRLRVEVRVVANGVEYVHDVLLDTRAPVEDFQTREIGTEAAATELALTRDIETEAPEVPEHADVKDELGPDLNP